MYQLLHGEMEFQVCCAAMPASLNLRCPTCPPTHPPCRQGAKKELQLLQADHPGQQEEDVGSRHFADKLQASCGNFVQRCQLQRGCKQVGGARFPPSIMILRAAP